MVKRLRIVGVFPVVVFAALLALKARAESPFPALAAADGETPGTRVEVTELKRTSGGTVLLKFALINDSAADLGFGTVFTDNGVDFNSLSGVALVDPVNRKKHLAILDTDKRCLCSRGLHPIKRGSHAALWVQFPEPPAEVQRLNIVIPHFDPMTDVPLASTSLPTTRR